MVERFTIELPEEICEILKKLFQSTKETPETILVDWLVNPVWIPLPEEVEYWAEQLPTFSLIQLWTMVYRGVPMDNHAGIWRLAINELKNRGEDVDHEATRWGIAAGVETIPNLGDNVLWAIVNSPIYDISNDVQVTESLEYHITNVHKENLIRRELALAELEKRGHDIDTYLTKFEKKSSSK